MRPEARISAISAMLGRPLAQLFAVKAQRGCEERSGIVAAAMSAYFLLRRASVELRSHASNHESTSALE
jgi:hypothetical protein